MLNFFRKYCVLLTICKGDLKEISDLAAIEKRLTHHIARRATTLLLFNNLPKEIVSELLGHSNRSITQEYYGKVVMKKVSDEIMKLNGRI